MRDNTTKPLALVTGVGPGTGAAVARRFAQGGYRVAMLARDAERLAALQREIPDSGVHNVEVPEICHAGQNRKIRLIGKIRKA